MFKAFCNHAQYLVALPHLAFCLSHSLMSLCPPAGLEGMECSLPTDGRQISLNMLSEESFRECRGVLSLKDYLIVIFSGICISVAAIIASFFLASIIHCFQRLKAKRTDEEEGDEWASAMLQSFVLDRFTTTAPEFRWRMNTMCPYKKSPDYYIGMSKVRVNKPPYAQWLTTSSNDAKHRSTFLLEFKFLNQALKCKLF